MLDYTLTKNNSQLTIFCDGEELENYRQRELGAYDLVSELLDDLRLLGNDGWDDITDQAGMTSDCLIGYMTDYDDVGDFKSVERIYREYQSWKEDIYGILPKGWKFYLVYPEQPLD